MDMDIIYYIILVITVVSYLLGLFLSHFEKKGEVSLLSDMGNGGFINIFGTGSQRSSRISLEAQQQLQQQMQQEMMFQQGAQMQQHPFQSSEWDPTEILQEPQIIAIQDVEPISNPTMDDEII